MLKYLSILAASIVTLSFPCITKAESIYWIDDGKKIQRAALDGSNVTDLLATDQSALTYLEVTDSFIYWLEGGKKIRRAALDGSNVTDLLVTDQSFLSNIEVTDSFIYWLEGGKIQRANLDGSNVMNIATLPVNISNLVVNRSCIYWTMYFGGGTSISRAALDGSNVIKLAFLEDARDRYAPSYNSNSGIWTTKTLPGSPYFIFDMEVTDSFIYWTSLFYGSDIQRSSLDGFNAITLVKKGRPTSLTVSSSYIFWTDRQRIYRANLDGSNVNLILKKGLTKPSFLATDAVLGTPQRLPQVCQPLPQFVCPGADPTSCLKLNLGFSL